MPDSRRDGSGEPGKPGQILEQGWRGPKREAAVAAPFPALGAAVQMGESIPEAPSSTCRSKTITQCRFLGCWDRLWLRVGSGPGQEQARGGVLQPLRLLSHSLCSPLQG